MISNPMKSKKDSIGLAIPVLSERTLCGLHFIIFVSTNSYLLKMYELQFKNKMYFLQEWKPVIQDNKSENNKEHYWLCSLSAMAFLSPLLTKVMQSIMDICEYFALMQCPHHKNKL